MFNLGSLGSLFIDVAANTAHFESDMGRAARIADKRAKEIQKGITEAAEKIFVVFETYKIADRLVESIDRTIESMDKMGKAAQKVGIGTMQLSELEYAARQADIQFDALTGGLGKFSKAIVEAKNGGGAQVAAFNALGISIDEVKRLSPDELLKRVASAFAGAEDNADKTAIAMTLFGKSGADLIPLLNGGAAAIARAADEAHRFGIVVTESAAKAADEFRSNLTRLKAAGEGVGNMVTQNLIGNFAEATSQLVDYVSEVDRAREAADLMTKGIKKIALGAAIVGESVYGVVKAVSALAGSFEVVFADLDLFGKFLAHGGPAGLAFESNRKALAEALDQRNQVLKAANERYVDLINYNGTAVSDALRAAYAKEAGVQKFDPLAGISAALHPNVVPFSPALQQQAPFAFGLNAASTGEKATLSYNTATEAARKQISEAERMIQRLREQVALYGDLTELDKVRINIAQGYWGIVTPAQTGTLEQLARELDFKKAIAVYDGQLLKDEGERIDQIRKQNEELQRRAERAAREVVKPVTAANLRSSIDANPFEASKLTKAALDDEHKFYAQQQALFSEAQAKKLDIGYDYNQLVERAAKEHEDRLTQISKVGNDARKRLLQNGLALAGNVFGALGDLQDKNSREGFERYKRFAIAQAIVSTINGAIGAFTQTASVYPAPYGEIAGAVAAAAVVAAGYAQIAQIRSQQFSGRRYGGPVSAGGMYEVAEGGNPELLKYGDKTLLMMGDKSGTVSPAKSGAMMATNDGGDVNLTVQVIGSNGPASATASMTDEGLLVRLAVNGAQAAVQKDIQTGGPTSRLLQQTFSLQRAGR